MYSKRFCGFLTFFLPCLPQRIPAHFLLLTSTFLNGVGTLPATNGQISWKWEPCSETGSRETLVSTTPTGRKVIALEYTSRWYCCSIRRRNLLNYVSRQVERRTRQGMFLRNFLVRAAF